jgi:hypothetical protein
MAIISTRYAKRFVRGSASEARRTTDTLAPGEIRSLKSVLTMVDGRIVYDTAQGD